MRTREPQNFDICTMPRGARVIYGIVADDDSGMIASWRTARLWGSGLFDGTCHITTLGREFYLDTTGEHPVLKMRRRGKHGQEINMIDRSLVIPDTEGSRLVIAMCFAARVGLMPHNK